MDLKETKRSHDTVLHVDVKALRYNLNQYKKLLPNHTKVMVMVKANGYGSGLEEIARFLQREKVDLLGVAYVDAAIHLRQYGISIPIMVMNPHIDSYSLFEEYQLRAAIFSIHHLKRLISDTKITPYIHIKIDSGMHRLGFDPNEIPALLEILRDNPTVKVEGIFTHFSSSDMESEDNYTHSQAEIFSNAYDSISKAIGFQPTKHALNSSGIVRFPEYHFDMIRLGIGLHGFDPTGNLHLRLASQLETFISQVRNLKEGDTVGYSRKGKLNRDSRIAIIPIGYEDGYLRLFGNGKATVKINGTNCPTVGNICMDMTMVDVTDIECEEGDKVIVFGRDPRVEQLAKWANTIPYEILTNISTRVRREFVS
ncbi:MAG: alanine racemase [Ekhidna sp.]